MIDSLRKEKTGKVLLVFALILAVTDGMFISASLCGLTGILITGCDVALRKTVLISGVLLAITSFNMEISHRDEQEREVRRVARVAELHLAEQKREVRRVASVAELSKDRVNILASIEAAISKKDFTGAKSQSSAYLDSNDPEIQRLHSIALAELKEIENRGRIKYLISILGATPENEYYTKLRHHRELARLVPTNADYSERRDFFQKKVNLENVKKAKAKVVEAVEATPTPPLVKSPLKGVTNG
jgi:hypothetical protein